MREEEEEEEENNLLVANSNCWKHAAAVIVVVVEEEEVVVIYFFLYSLPLQLVAQHGNKKASKREGKKKLMPKNWHIASYHACTGQDVYFNFSFKYEHDHICIN